MKYIPTIGLEIHAELKTATKMFCRCKNDSNEKQPNINICPICLGHPGTLPVINKKAVEAVIKTGLALQGKVANYSQFDRKNYFYPDLPKGYQISQYGHPLVKGGVLKGIRITRIHIEEDTGKLGHAVKDSSLGKFSLVDFNRAGVPLMELVTEPDIKTAGEAVMFASELQLILRYLEVSNADMEKGEMRIEANISLSATGERGTKVEVKNINSFKAVFNAIEYEIKRQEELLREGKKIIQETRGWDDIKKITVSQRIKEESHDYRYFPEPDLPPLDLKKMDLEEIKRELPELPEAKRKRFVAEFSLSLEQAGILAQDKASADYFESAASELKAQSPITNYQSLFNYFVTDLRGLMNERGINFQNLKISPEHLAHLIALIENKILSSRLAKNILLKMFETGEDPETIMNTEGLMKISGASELQEIVKKVIEENSSAVSDYRKGKIASLQFLIGQAMARTRGQANPDILRELFLDHLSK